jgi:hypothetical protein
MTSLGRRLKRIEAAFQPNVALGAERNDAMLDLSLHHLSRENLTAMRGIVLRGAQGHQLAPYTERESEAMKALNRAFELEVQKAGYATVREFQWSCGIELRSA